MSYQLPATSEQSGGNGDLCTYKAITDKTVRANLKSCEMVAFAKRVPNP